MSKKILIVVTTVGALRGGKNDGHPTGWYLPEASHVFAEAKKAGVECTFASVAGGAAPVDPGSKAVFADGAPFGDVLIDDPVSKEFMYGEDIKALETTVKLADVNGADYGAVWLAGGHGCVYDFPDNADITRVANETWKAGGVVAACCHGSVGLPHIKLEGGEPMVKGLRVTGFSNEEEEAVQMVDSMPVITEDALIAAGGKYEKADAVFGECVVVDGQLMTGQNPASSAGLAKAVVAFVTKQ